MLPQASGPSLSMKPTASGVMPAEPDLEESIEQLWEDYVSELTAILLCHLPDLWHVLHVRPGLANGFRPFVRHARALFPTCHRGHNGCGRQVTRTSHRCTLLGLWHVLHVRPGQAGLPIRVHVMCSRAQTHAPPRLAPAHMWALGWWIALQGTGCTAAALML